MNETTYDTRESFAVWALAINGESTLNGDPNGDGHECMVRSSSIDMLSYDEPRDTITIWLRNGTTLEVHGHRREVYIELTRWAFADD